jgi:MFS family permease
MACLFDKTSISKNGYSYLEMLILGLTASASRALVQIIGNSMLHRRFLYGLDTWFEPNTSSGLMIYIGMLFGGVFWGYIARKLFHLNLNWQWYFILFGAIGGGVIPVFLIMLLIRSF